MLVQQTNEKLEQINMLKRQNKIGEETANDQIKQIKAEAVGALLKNTQTRAQTASTQQDTKVKEQEILNMQRQLVNMVQENMREWDKMNFEERKIRVQEKLAEWNTDADKFTIKKIS